MGLIYDIFMITIMIFVISLIFVFFIIDIWIARGHMKENVELDTNIYIEGAYRFVKSMILGVIAVINVLCESLRLMLI
jgi:hypothetical protein